MSKGTSKAQKKILVSGGLGKMGTEILSILQAHPDFQAHSIVDIKRGPSRVPVYTEVGDIPFSQIDGVIDFSSPELFRSILKGAADNGKPFVSGTTGLSDSDQKFLTTCSKKIPVLWAPNMSLGVAFIKKLLAEFQFLSGYDFQIEEFHHNQKKDNPGGTAIQLQGALESAVGRKLPAPIGIRGGGIFGIHKIHCMGPEEVITIEHNALQRSLFARGAVDVMRWLVAKKGPGKYSLDDVLGGTGAVK
ncbi:MAG: 4-hydroxy-tetrahydrodipicolinate reductase [Bdellovibrionales bacterium]|nr:4-hydroxy-tetrahydrodipicolinate reductase [Bdellovibrionales bacterium]